MLNPDTCCRVAALTRSVVTTEAMAFQLWRDALRASGASAGQQAAMVSLLHAFQAEMGAIHAERCALHDAVAADIAASTAAAAR